jgi:hypothetical protein
MAANRITGDTLVVSGRGKIGAVTITPTSDDTTLTIYDSLTTGGTVVFHGEADWSVSQGSVHFPYIPAIAFETGCYAEVTGTAPEIVIYIDQS